MANGNDPRAFLEKLLAERATKADELTKLDFAIEAIRRMLGEQPEQSEVEGLSPRPTQVLRQELVRQVGTLSTRPDEFFGMSQTTGAEAFLRKVGHAVGLEQILDALSKGGLAIGGGDPRKTLYTQLVRATRKFVLVSPNTFGLRDFYPNLGKKEKRALAEAGSKRQGKKTGRGKARSRRKPDHTAGASERGTEQEGGTK